MAWRIMHQVGYDTKYEGRSKWCLPSKSEQARARAPGSPRSPHALSFLVRVRLTPTPTLTLTRGRQAGEQAARTLLLG